MTDAVTVSAPQSEMKGRSLFQLAVMRFRRNRPAMAGSVMLVLIALSVNLLGDWLRDALNPRLR